MTETLEMITPDEAERILKIPARRVRAMIRAGELPGRRLGHTYRVNLRALERLLAEPAGANQSS